jgi:probable phosphoglycerate mutase
MAAETLTTFLLIRHAVHELGGDTIVGRLAGVGLSSEGRAQAEGLVERLEGVAIDAVYSSPVQRTLETAGPLARSVDLRVEVCDDVQEIDYGDWTGRRLESLRDAPEWGRWNSFRSGSRAPSGESMIEVQTRVMACLMRLRQQHPSGCVVVFSHGDVIKAAVAYCLGAPLDLFQRIEISPTSISVIAVGDRGPWVVCTNSLARVSELPTL